MPIISNELSEREQEILCLIATGASNKEIAQQLFISTNTVKVHLRNIFTKIGASSRTEAAMYAVSAGLVPGMAQVQEEGDALDVNAASAPVQPTSQGQVPSFPAAGSGLSRFGRLTVLALLGVAILALALAGYMYWRASAAQVLQMPPALTLPSATDSPRWQFLSSMPAARYGLAISAYEGLIYAIGGNSGGAATDAVERFDPSLNAWSILAKKPTPVYDVGAVVLGGNIYVPGGRLSSGEVTNVLEIYDPRQDRWTSGPALPQPLSAYALAAFEGRMFLFGGWDGKEAVATVYEYHPEVEQWVSRTPMLTARYYAGAALVGRRIFVTGGLNDRDVLNANEVYYPDLDQEDGVISGDAWQKASPLPFGRYGMGVASLADVVLVFGGVDENNSTPPSLQYLPQTDAWQSFERLGPESWLYLGVAPLNSQIYILGGKLNDLPTDRALAYQAIYTLAIPVVPRQSDP